MKLITIHYHLRDTRVFLTLSWQSMLHFVHVIFVLDLTHVLQMLKKHLQNER